MLLIDNARVLDVRKGVIVENARILVNGKYIVDIGTSGSVDASKAVDVIDARGKLVMPGLIDAHMHLSGLRTGDVVKEPLLTSYETMVARAVKDLEALAEAGFTTIVDAGGLIALGLKQAVEEGTLKGPRIVAAGAPLSQTFGHGDTHYLPLDLVDVRSRLVMRPFGSLICDGVDECRKAARYALRMGSDFIKIFTTGGVLSQRDRPEYTQFTLEEIKAIVEEAKAAGRFVHAHAEGDKGIINALLGGVKVIAHADMIDDEGIRLAIEKNAVVVPTLAVSEHILTYGRELGLPDWALEKESFLFQYHVERARKAWRAGVKLATGTDFWGGVKAFRHGDNALEIVLFVEKIGMPPAEALKAATINAAEVAGLSHVTGSLEKGKLADLIIVDGNPLDNPRILLDKDRILFVMKEGKVLKNKLSSL
ncbi:amidohydrolase family protein [Thermogladius sp. 4427co]|uniref:metal-dependent hydrolase family protein n=1 Tax=Thermogladius sp. 4427co TaxID=3450718 RepID=UPI003F7AAB51